MSVERAYQSIMALEMCSKFSEYFLEKGQKVSPPYFSLKFARITFVLVIKIFQRSKS